LFMEVLKNALARRVKPQRLHRLQKMTVVHKVVKYIGKYNGLSYVNFFKYKN
jgi:hypothetical protein